MHRFYPAPLDRYARWITRGYWLLSLLIVGSLLAATIASATREGVVATLGTALALAGIGFVSWALQPRLYLLDGGELRIERRALFPPARRDLATVRRVAPFELPRLTIRLWGIGGLYGWIGWFWSSGVGSYWICATHLGELVLLEGDGRWVVSPENRAEFIAAVCDHLELAPPTRDEPIDPLPDEPAS